MTVVRSACAYLDRQPMQTRYPFQYLVIDDRNLEASDSHRSMRVAERGEEAAVLSQWLQACPARVDGDILERPKTGDTDVVDACLLRRRYTERRMQYMLLLMLLLLLLLLLLLKGWDGDVLLWVLRSSIEFAQVERLPRWDEDRHRWLDANARAVVTINDSG